MFGPARAVLDQSHTYNFPVYYYGHDRRRGYVTGHTVHVVIVETDTDMMWSATASAPRWLDAKSDAHLQYVEIFTHSQNPGRPGLTPRCRWQRLVLAGRARNIDISCVNVWCSISHVLCNCLHLGVVMLSRVSAGIRHGMIPVEAWCTNRVVNKHSHDRSRDAHHDKRVHRIPDMLIIQEAASPSCLQPEIHTHAPPCIIRRLLMYVG